MTVLIEASRKETRTALPRTRDTCFQQMQNNVYDTSRTQLLPDKCIMTEIGRHFAIAKDATKFVVVFINPHAERVCKERALKNIDRISFRIIITFQFFNSGMGTEIVCYFP